MIANPLGRLTEGINQNIFCYIKLALLSKNQRGANS